MDINGFWNTQRGRIQRTDTAVNQAVNNPFFGVRNNLRLLKTVGKQLITFRSNTGYTRADQELYVTPGQFPQLLNNGQNYPETSQFLESTRVFIDNSAGFTKKLGGFTLSPKLGFSIENKHLDSNLLATSATGGTYFQNRLNFLSTAIYLENAVRFQSKDETWNLRLSAPLQFKSFRLEDENFPQERKLDRFVLAPDFYVKKSLSAYWEASASASLTYDFGNIKRLYRGFLLTDYRNVQRYDAPISEQVTQDYTGRSSYRNPLSQLFANGSYSYNRGKNNLLYSNWINPDGTTQVEALERDNSNSRHRCNFGGSKYFSALKSTLKLNANYTLSTQQQILNGNPTEVENKSLQWGAHLETEVAGWLSLSYDATFSYYETAFENARFQQISINDQDLNLFFYLSENQYVNASAEYYGNSLSQENGSSYFLNFSYRHTFETPKMDLNLSWNNVLNTDAFINAYTSEYSYVESRYELRPSQVLVSLRFSF